MTTITNTTTPPTLAPIIIHIQDLASGSSVPTDGKENQHQKERLNLSSLKSSAK